MVEGHVPQGVGVQVPPSACKGRLLVTFLFCLYCLDFFEKSLDFGAAFLKNISLTR
jgi:hypothetical protein